MSEHTKGKLVVDTFSVQAFLLDEKERGVAFEISKEDARRLAAAWNACEGMTTEAIEALAGIGSMGNLKASELGAANQRIAKLEALVAERDAMLGKRPCQNSRCNELNAARALLREVLKGEKRSILHHEVAQRVGDYLDACDTLGGA